MNSRLSSSSRVYESKPNNINKKLIKVKWICKKKKRQNLIIIKWKKSATVKDWSRQTWLIDHDTPSPKSDMPSSSDLPLTTNASFNALTVSCPRVSMCKYTHTHSLTLGKTNPNEGCLGCFDVWESIPYKSSFP